LTVWTASITGQPAFSLPASAEERVSAVEFVQNCHDIIHIFGEIGICIPQYANQAGRSSALNASKKSARPSDTSSEPEFPAICIAIPINNS
jgi:hypothetical protein